VSATFPARFDGVCAKDCGNRIHPGDIVRYEGDALHGDGRLVHDECAEKPSRFDIAPTEVVCGVCWLIKPCKCDD
jgi:hypothetical protein